MGETGWRHWMGLVLWGLIWAGVPSSSFVEEESTNRELLRRNMEHATGDENRGLTLEQVCGRGVGDEVRQLIPKVFESLLRDVESKSPGGGDTSRRAATAEDFTSDQTTRVRMEAWLCPSRRPTCDPSSASSRKAALQTLWNDAAPRTNSWNRTSVYAKTEDAELLLQVSDHVTSSKKESSAPPANQSGIQVTAFPEPYPEAVTARVPAFLREVLQNAAKAPKSSGNHAEETFEDTYRIRITVTYNHQSSLTTLVDDVMKSVKEEQLKTAPVIIRNKEAFRVKIEICERVQPAAQSKQ